MAKNKYEAKFVGDLDKYDLTKPFLINPHPDAYVMESIQYDHEVNDVDLYIFGIGLAAPEKNYNITLHSAVPERGFTKFDILPNMSPVGFIYNRKAVDILEKVCPEDFQLFPVTIVNDPEKSKLEEFENKNYFLINITHSVKAINMTQSTFSGYFTDGAPRGVEKASLLHDSMGKHHLAVDSYFHSHKLVSYELAYNLIQHKITGVTFVMDYMKNVGTISEG